MLRFIPGRSDSLRKPRWPDVGQREPTTVFSGRPPLRELTVLIDHSVLAEDGGGPESLALLPGLLTHPYVQLLRYADDGPPRDARRVAHPPLNVEVVPGWAILSNRDAAPQHQVVTTGDDDRCTQTAVSGNLPDVAEDDTSTNAYSDLDPETRRKQRRADAMALQVARAVRADVFVTRRPYLHAVSWARSDGVTLASPKELLPLLSLYLRTQDEFITYRNASGSFTRRMNRGLFYWVGARSLLPAGWRWFSACVQHSHASGDDQLVFLAQSLFQRAQRALQARDEVHRALNTPQNNDVAEDALSSLDFVFLALMGAIDVSARVAHLALGVSDKPYEAGWQRDGWRKKVRRSSPTLAALVQQGTVTAHQLTVLATLRNSIHGAALGALSVADADRREQTLVGLPHADSTKLMGAMNALGGPSAWGVRQVLPGRFHADPGQLLDKVFQEAVDLLNALMAATPVEQLKGVSIRPEDTVPPTDGWPDEHTCRSIISQLGF